MDWGEIILNLFLDLILTVFFYLLVPVIFRIRKKPMTQKQIKKVIIINGVCVCLFFGILAGRVSAAVFLWSWVGKKIMEKGLLAEEESDETKIVEQNENIHSATEQTESDSCQHYENKIVEITAPKEYVKEDSLLNDFIDVKSTEPEIVPPDKKVVKRKLRPIIIIIATVLALVLLVGAISLIITGLISEEKGEDDLYNWLLENGELVDGSKLEYKDGNFTLHTYSLENMRVEYVIPNYYGYKITVQLPLFSTSEAISTTLIVSNASSSSTIVCEHYPKNFTVKTPMTYDIKSEYPDYENIIMDDYGTFKYENGKYVFYLDESKRAEYEKKKQYNDEIDAQRELREKIAKEISHQAISDILDWISTDICPLANMEISDFGYETYTPN